MLQFISVLFGARFIVVKGAAHIDNNRIDFARHLAIENAKILALENVRGVTIDQKAMSNDSLLIYSKNKSELNGRILKYSILREWIDSNNYWVEIGALVSEKNEKTDLLITISSSDTVLENCAIAMFQKEGFSVLEKPRDFFPMLTLNSTVTEKKSYEFYGKKASYTRVLVTAKLRDIDGSVYEFSEFGDSSDLFLGKSLEHSLTQAVINLASKIRNILDAPKKLYLEIKSVNEDTDELQKILDFLNDISLAAKVEYFGNEGNLLCVIEVTEDPLIFLSRIVKYYRGKINLTWKNGVYEMVISGGA